MSETASGSEPKFYVEFSFKVQGFKQVFHLDEGSGAGEDGETEDDDLCAVIDPEHLAPELLAVLHHEEDDDDDDSTHKAQEAQEKS